MGKAAPPIEYTAQRVLVNSWWEAMQRANLTVRFYSDSYGSASTLYPPHLTDEPSPFGGWVYRDEQVLGVVGWDWNSATHAEINCVVVSNPPQGDFVHWVMIGCGARKPRIPMNRVDKAFLIECLGSFYQFYSIGDRFWCEWSDFLSTAQHRTEECEFLPVLPSPYFARKIHVGRHWCCAESIEVCAGPSSAQQRHFAVVRAGNLTRGVKSSLRDLDVAILRGGGHVVDIFDEGRQEFRDC